MADNDDKLETNFTMTVTKDDAKWLKKTYPGAKSTQERLRMAISDARIFRSEKSDD